MSKRIEMAGRKFGRLTVLERTADYVLPSGQRQLMWKCVCDCGNTVTVSGHALRKGNTQSCGCYKMDVLMERNIKYEHQNRRLYDIWQGMVYRCTSPKSTHFERYGGRGISVCQQWMDFDAFAEWALAHGYADDLTIDRIDNDAGYSPNNCRWVNRKEQANNRSDCQFINHDGDRQTIAQLADAHGLSYSTLYRRLADGWDCGDALTIKPSPNTILTHNGETHILKEWAAITGIHRDTIMRRIGRGWSVDDALTIPVQQHHRYSTK